MGARHGGGEHGCTYCRADRLDSHPPVHVAVDPCRRNEVRDAVFDVGLLCRAAESDPDRDRAHRGSHRRRPR